MRHLSSVAVLAYHKVADRARQGEPSWMAVPPSAFGRQMETLQLQGFRTIGPRELIGILGGERAVPGRPLLITFDDGYRDNYGSAFPILARHGFTATVFLIGDYLEGAPASHRPCPRAVPDVPMLSEREIRDLAAAGWSFGSHGMSHRRLPELPEDQLRWELVTSRHLISRLTGQEVELLAYPYGATDSRVARLAAEAGYRAAFTVRKGPVRQGADWFAIRRTLVGPKAGPALLSARLHPVGRAATSVAHRIAEVVGRSRR